MAESSIFGARVPLDWQQQISALGTVSRYRKAEVVREALAQDLGKTDPASIKGVIADWQDSVNNLGRKLAGLGRLGE
jgi:RHH-type rel operon transcriptional repressor/antitoxin RelB